MVDKNKLYTVKNRSVGVVVYNIREDNIRREFSPGEIKKISYGELEKLSFQPGGRNLMTNYLQIQEVEGTENLGVRRELEYDMSEQDVIKLIKEDSLDKFLDCLDFAPEGVIDLIKVLAIQLPMTDTEKRKALKQKTGFDVTAAIMNMEKEKADEETPEIAPATERRVKPAAAQPTRRVPEYKITNTETKTE